MSYGNETDEYIQVLDALAHQRGAPIYRLDSLEYERQMGEANAFAMARRLYLTGDYR